MRRAAKKLPVKSDQLPATNSDSAPKGIPLSKIVELDAKGISQSEIATLLGCSKQAISERLRGTNLVDLKDYRDNKPLHMVHLQQRLVDSLSDADLKSMSPYQRILTSAIVEDKFMPKQQQTPNVLAISVIVGEIDKRIRKQDTQDIVVEPIVKQEDN
jgi:predicted transcriptional regulator